MFSLAVVGGVPIDIVGLLGIPGSSEEVANENGQGVLL